MSGSGSQGQSDWIFQTFPTSPSSSSSRRSYRYRGSYRALKNCSHAQVLLAPSTLRLSQANARQASSMRSRLRGRSLYSVPERAPQAPPLPSARWPASAAALRAEAAHTPSGAVAAKCSRPRAQRRSSPRRCRAVRREPSTSRASLTLESLTPGACTIVSPRKKMRTSQLRMGVYY